MSVIKFPRIFRMHDLEQYNEYFDGNINSFFERELRNITTAEDFYEDLTTIQIFAAMTFFETDVPLHTLELFIENCQNAPLSEQQKKAIVKGWKWGEIFHDEKLLDDYRPKYFRE